MAITAQAFFVAHGFGHRLTERDTDVFNCVVTINVQVAGALNVEVYQSVPGNLVEHVVKKANAGRQIGLTSAVKVELDGNFGLGGVARDLG